MYQTVFAISISVKVYTESTRINIFIAIFTHLILVFSKFLSHQNYFILLIALLLQITYFASIVIMPVLMLPPSTGPYASGYREYDDNVSVYYPVEKELILKYK